MRNNLVVIIDSGIDTKDRKLMEHVVGGCRFVLQDRQIEMDDMIDDCHGHGTNCADLILEMNAQAVFYIINIVNQDGLSHSELMLTSLKKCLEVPARIICMSLSVTTHTCDYEDEIHAVCGKLNEQGKLICISENNEMEGSEPARFSEVIGVRAYYEGTKNTWRINENADIQVTADGSPVFLRGRNGSFNFFKGSSKSNAFFAGVILQYLQKENIRGMKETLIRIKQDSVYQEENEPEKDFGIGRVAETEQDKQLEEVIKAGIYEISGQLVELNILRRIPIMSQITGISYFKFYELITWLYRKLGIKEEDYHSIKANDICTLYRLRKYLRERLQNEEKEQGISIYCPV